MSLQEEERVLSLLKKFDLPTEYVIKDVDDFYEHFFLDKKECQQQY